MKRGKDEEKMMGPMFPRLHVNDTEKGGPRAPPRNKMALYEQLSVPSQRFNPGVMPLKSNNASNLVPPASSSQGSGHERGVFFPHHISPSTPTHLPEKLHARHSDAVILNTPLAQFEQRKKQGEEDDFRVPIFVHSGTEFHGRNQNSIDREILTPSSSTCLGHSIKLQNVCEKELKRTSSNGLNVSRDMRSQGDMNRKDYVSSREYSEKSASNLSTKEKIEESMKQVNKPSSEDCRDQSSANFSSLHDTDGCLPKGNRAGAQLGEPDHVDCVSVETARDARNTSRVRSSSYSGDGLGSPGEPDNDSACRGDKTCGTLQKGNADANDDLSETSMVDSMSGLDITPDDVVGVIGQKHFWKARRAIVNQQRVFAVQVFELHRLIKVQRLIAGSPHLLVDESAYLGKPSLQSSPAKKLPLEYVVKPLPNMVMHKDNSERASHQLECSAENAVGKTPLPSVRNGNPPSNYGPYIGNPPPAPAPTDSKMGPWCYPQPPGHQWLVPVMSPSEGLVYKPYPGPGFMSTACGGCGPMGPAPMTGSFINPAYGVPASHHHQGIGVHPVTPPIGHGYFPPYGMSVMNHPTISGSAVEQMNRFAGHGSLSQTGQLSGGGASFNTQHQNSCNVPTPKRAIPQGVKFPMSKDSEFQGSTASSPSEREQQVGTGDTAEGRDPLPLFPMAPAAVPAGDSQPNGTDQPTRVIRVVPHNPRSATESAARIFQSIQDERKQLDSDHNVA
ncbi:hypothetical protein PVL29_003921 [Vitis rotundifolia]|uniref:Protein EARLY FLOWERING 3 n=1 Tax=Vitis rotundifolia TaxID=103349 RepID=A0AA39A7G4_VITRO|nr:hypothetical protein PVL29_003921 [Vitis rotundifolia]